MTSDEPVTPRRSASTRRPSTRRLRPTLIFAGGAAGTAVRVGWANLVPGVWATLVVNLVGALALGYLLARIRRAVSRSSTIQPLLAVGFFGALTTFSGMVLEVTQLAGEGHAVAMIGYAGSSLLGGITLALIGLRLGEGRR